MAEALQKFRVVIREARRSNGHAEEPPVSADYVVTAVDWYSARLVAANDHSIDPMDPAMFVVKETG